jgi:hypothetical protein
MEICQKGGICYLFNHFILFSSPTKDSSKSCHLENLNIATSIIKIFDLILPSIFHLKNSTSDKAKTKKNPFKKIWGFKKIPT